MLTQIMAASSFTRSLFVNRVRFAKACDEFDLAPSRERNVYVVEPLDEPVEEEFGKLTRAEREQQRYLHLYKLAR